MAYSLEDQEEHFVVDKDPSGRFERYQKCIGMGAYKRVYLAFDTEEGVEVAWNELRLSHLQKKDIVKVLSEVQILQQIRHENIINLYHSWVSNSQVYFITELMTSGTLKQFIRKKSGLKPKIIKNWCRQILKGLQYLHSRDPVIIHRDLKCENIFINGNNGQLKIGDLGLATVKDRNYVSSVLGTPEFMAPELYDEMYDEKVDIYSFGMCVLEMVTGEYPYSECTNQAQIYRKVTNNIKPVALDKVGDLELKQFIELCIQHSADKRPNCLQLLNHPFLNDNNGNANANANSSNILLVEVVEFTYPKAEMKMIINNEQKQEVKFPFNIELDSPESVVDEMFREGVLLKEDTMQAQLSIGKVIDQLLRENNLLTNTTTISSNSSSSNSNPTNTNTTTTTNPNEQRLRSKSVNNLELLNRIRSSSSPLTESLSSPASPIGNKRHLFNKSSRRTRSISGVFNPSTTMLFNSNNNPNAIMNNNLSTHSLPSLSLQQPPQSPQPLQDSDLVKTIQMIKERQKRESEELAKIHAVELLNLLQNHRDNQAPSLQAEEAALHIPPEFHQWSRDEKLMFLEREIHNIQLTSPTHLTLNLGPSSSSSSFSSNRF